MDNLLFMCFAFMRWWADNTPLTYEEVNVWWFVIIQPILMVLFLILAIIASNVNNERIKSVLKAINITIMSMYAVALITIFIVPLF